MFLSGRPSLLLVLALSTVALDSASAARAQPARDPVAERTEAMVTLIRSAPDEAAVARFVGETYAASALAARPVGERVPILMRVLGDLRGGSVESVRILSPTRAEIVARGGELWMTISLEIEAAPPHGILGLGIQADQGRPEAGEAAADTTPLDESEALRRIDAEISRRAGQDRFSGVVLVARDGKPLYSRADGLADRGLGVPNRIDTKFNLGSINKIFTSIVVHQLAAEGQLRLDGPLVEALPDYPNRDVAGRVTLRQLLDHSSGLGDFFNDRFDESTRRRLRSLADYLPLFVDDPLEFEPGTARRYSNAGYLVLGLVIERATGRSYYDAVHERIFEPAGMRDTAWWAVDDVVPNRAVGYTQGREIERDPTIELRSNVLALPARGSSAGGGFSTASDLLRFAAALAGGRLLPPGAEGPRAGIGVAGGSDGVNATLEVGEPGAPTLVVLANLDPPAAESLAQLIRGLLRRVR
jgi:CubicO group peptidase (beta-lactamase class C family)